MEGEKLLVIGYLLFVIGYLLVAIEDRHKFHPPAFDF
jgi:hypothetical protein